MKKTFLVVLVAVFAISYQAKAQLGVKVGYNFAKQSGDVQDGYSDKSLNNVFFGAFMEKDIIPLLDIRIGAEFSPKGSRAENGDLFDEWKINYLEIPVQAKLKLGPVYALGGVYGAYALGGKYEDQDGSADIDFDALELKRFDYGMKFGAGVQTGLGPLHIFAQAEYSFGLQNLSKMDGVDTKNTVLSVSAGLVIGF